jgi:hypothetical protein
MKELGSERWVIVCGWVGDGDAFVDLKEINAKWGGGFGGLRAFSSQLLALLSCTEAISASAEGRGKDGNEKIVRERWVILCGWDAGGEGRGRFKGFREWGGLRIGADFGGIRNRSWMHRRLRLPTLRRVDNGCERNL